MQLFLHEKFQLACNSLEAHIVFTFLFAYVFHTFHSFIKCVLVLEVLQYGVFFKFGQSQSKCFQGLI